MSGNLKITTKLTTEVDTQTYDRITRNMHHGQLSQVIRGFVASLDKLLQGEDKDQVFLWLYSNKPLLLPAPKGDSDVQTPGS